MTARNEQRKVKKAIVPGQSGDSILFDSFSSREVVNRLRVRAAFYFIGAYRVSSNLDRGLWEFRL